RCLFEGAREVVGRQADELRQHTIADVVRQMGDDIFVDAPKIARPQAPATRKVNSAAFGYGVQARDASALTTPPSKVVIAISENTPDAGNARGVFILVSITKSDDWLRRC